jgi:putative transposase
VTYGRDLPRAVACLEDDFEACIAHPPGTPPGNPHHQSARVAVGEQRRRTKVIPHAFGERAVLKLMYAALIRAAEGWRGIRVSEFEQRQLKAIHEQIDQGFAARN